MKGKSDILDRNIRQCMAYTVKKNGPFRWSKLLGYTGEQLRKQLEDNFTEGMSFDNYGEWVISFNIPKRCYNFKSIRDPDFMSFFALKNIVPKWLKDAQHQKKEISKKILNEKGLWDILPIGDISKYLVD